MKLKTVYPADMRSRLEWLFRFSLCALAAGLFPLNISVAKPCQQDLKTPVESKGEAAEKDGNETDFDSAAQLETFDQVWETIKKSHWDSEKVGKSWDEAKDKYRPQIEEATSINDVRKTLGEMINELGQSHFGVIPADAYDVVEGDTGDGYAGLTFRLANDETVLVTDVVEDSPAAKAKIQPGWQLLQVGDKTVDELMPKLKKAAHGPLRVETIVGMTMGRLGTGETGSEKAFVFKNGDDEEVELELEMVEKPGEDSKFGNLPSMRVNFESSTIADGIGYFYFNVFFDPARVMPAYRKTVQDAAHKKGMVIDLRGNVGGLAGMTMGMARPFAKEQTKLGTMITRGNELKFAVFPESEIYEGPVAVLIDECSISSAEILSGGLKDIGAAKIFGRRSAGLALPSTVVKLPNGDGLQYAIANYISESGKSLEGDGVVPDEVIPLSRKELLKTGDPVLERAIEWIQSQSDSRQ